MLVVDTNRDIELLILKEINLVYPAKVATIEYDPNRTSYIALLHYSDGEKQIYCFS